MVGLMKRRGKVGGKAADLRRTKAAGRKRLAVAKPKSPPRAATGLQEIDHDTEVTSVFSVGHNRTVLRTEHAEALSKSFFAL